jgi:hypothetical protein
MGRVLLARISGSANPCFFFVIAYQGEMMSFPAGTTPFFPQLKSARGSSVQKIPARPMTQLISKQQSNCRSANPWLLVSCVIKRAGDFSYETRPRALSI